MQTLFHVPEVITGLLGTGFVVLSLLPTVRHNRRLRDTS